jgi:hypothetical protein
MSYKCSKLVAWLSIIEANPLSQVFSCYRRVLSDYAAFVFGLPYKGMKSIHRGRLATYPP